MKSPEQLKQLLNDYDEKKLALDMKYRSRMTAAFYPKEILECNDWYTREKERLRDEVVEAMMAE